MTRGRSELAMRALLSRPIMNPEVDMRLNLRRMGRNALLFLAAAAALASTTHGQDRAEGVFDVVPQQSRAGLVERLSEYVRYERTGQYERLYELLYEAGTDGEKKLSKEAWDSLLKGRPKAVSLVHSVYPMFSFSHSSSSRLCSSVINLTATPIKVMNLISDPSFSISASSSIISTSPVFLFQISSVSER
jgi:hypothetical protein